MKRIGLFTIYVENYGAVLQTYALSAYLKSLPSVESIDVIDFYSDNIYRVLGKIKCSSVLKTFLKRLYFLPYRHYLKERYQKERAFMKKSCSFSPKIASVDSIPEYDIYLTGSDQVFNLNSPYSDYFFQNFKTDKGKITYSSSLGTIAFPQDKEKVAVNLLSNFEYISVREKQSADYLTSLLNRKVECVVDPTLLLTADQWTSIAVEPLEKEYILVYDLNGGNQLLKIAKEVSSVLNIPIICICAKLKKEYKDINKMLYNVGPHEFVGYFKKATFVLTDSFHGTMFSLIFRKDFYTYIAVENTSIRIRSILERLGLDCRLVGNDFDITTFDKISISYVQKLESFIDSSKEYIRTAIEDY